MTLITQSFFGNLRNVPQLEQVEEEMDWNDTFNLGEEKLVIQEEDTVDLPIEPQQLPAIPPIQGGQDEDALPWQLQTR